MRETIDEIKALANCAHPCILSYVESFVQEDKIHLVTEYIDSCDLATEIKKRRTQATNNTNAQRKQQQQRPSADPSSGKRMFLENTILFIFVQLLLAVEYLHRHNILHRDLKSANILLSRLWLVKLCDFGLARQTGELDVAGNVSTSKLGTPYFMSPEIFRGRPYSSAADMYALGVILYQLITLDLPYQTSDPQKLEQLVLQGKYPPIQREDVSNELKRVAYSLLATDASRRPSAKMLLTDSPIIKETLENFVTKFGRITSTSTSELDRKWSDVLRDHYALLVEERRLYGAQTSSAKARNLTRSGSSQRARSEHGSRVVNNMSSRRASSTGTSVRSRGGESVHSRR